MAMIDWKEACKHWWHLANSEERWADLYHRDGQKAEMRCMEAEAESDRLRGLLRRSKDMLQRAKNFMTDIDEFDPELLDELAEELK